MKFNVAKSAKLHAGDSLAIETVAFWSKYYRKKTVTACILKGYLHFFQCFCPKTSPNT